MRLAACSGLREGELVTLRWRDVQVLGRKVVVSREAEGWPTNVLIDTTVQIDDPPPGARGGAIAPTPRHIR